MWLAGFEFELRHTALGCLVAAPLKNQDIEGSGNESYRLSKTKNIRPEIYSFDFFQKGK